EDGYKHLLLFTKTLLFPSINLSNSYFSSPNKINPIKLKQLHNMAFHFRRLCYFPALLLVVIQLLHGVCGQLVVVEEPTYAPPPPLVVIEEPTSSPPPPLDVVNEPISAPPPPLDVVNEPISAPPPPLNVVEEPLSAPRPPLHVVEEPISAPPPPLVKQDGNDGIVPALFVFGDSLIDNGNNNNIPSFAKANYFPYGIDFNGGPTGRFCNGLTMVDGIAQLLGLPLIPAYSEAIGDQVLRGVNYASAAAGILPDTGGNFMGRIPFDQQIHNFQTTLDQMASKSGGPVAIADSVARGLFFIGMGSNDYLNNYLMPNFPTRNQFNAHQFGDLLVQQYANHLTRLYNLGGRKFIVAGLGRMGCIPSILAQGTDGKCSEEVNQLVLPFNTNVKTMISNLNQNLPAAKFIYIDITHMLEDIIANPAIYGVTTLDKGCCGIGRNRGQITCLPFETPCPNRDQYLFWDAFHPTEKVNLIMAKKAFAGDRTVAFPINIQELASLS
ncbi:unnamed protein product, partial [Brassica oleracea]